MDDRTLARFLSKVEIQLDTGCWRWTGTVSEDGYGVFSMDRANHLAHRVAWKHYIGPIPPGLELDHLCHTRDLTCLGGVTDEHRRCVCPFGHLEPVTGLVNNQRSAPARKTHCDRGNHEYTPENTYIPPGGGRECRICRDDRSKAWMAEHNPGVRHGTETHCPSGHEYAGDNLIITPNGGRACRQCKNDWGREYMRRKRAAAKAATLAAAQPEPEMPGPVLTLF